MASGCVEGRDAALVGPLPDRALGDTEVLGSLAEREPIRLADGRKAMFVPSHAYANLPKAQPF
jgi:hypothetical protein